jgi:vacuolar-type H+-ATPase subunit F/Vma7
MTNDAQAASKGKPPVAAAPARMIALGSAALMEGFALIGFEIHIDPLPEDIERLMQELLRDRQSALVVIEHGLANNPGRHLARAQNEGGRIVVTEVPGLRLPENYHTRVETLVQEVLGASALEAKE